MKLPYRLEETDPTCDTGTYTRIKWCSSSRSSYPQLPTTTNHKPQSHLPTKTSSIDRSIDHHLHNSIRTKTSIDQSIDRRAPTQHSHFQKHITIVLSVTKWCTHICTTTPNSFIVTLQHHHHHLVVDVVENHDYTHNNKLCIIVIIILFIFSMLDVMEAANIILIITMVHLGSSPDGNRNGISVATTTTAASLPS